METKKECKHIYHHGGMARGISLLSPDFQDDVCIFLYCPKCLDQTTLVYRINKERTNTDKDTALIESIKAQHAEYVKLQSTKKEMELIKVRLIKNLVKLNYSKEHTENVLCHITSVDEHVLIPIVSAFLREEHKPMTKMIIGGDLVN